MPDDNGQGISYLTRGALLQCSYGTHPRRVNLVRDHGWGIDTETEGDGKEHPFMHTGDILVGDETMPAGQEQNISWFGICNSESKPDTETITLVNYGEEDAEDKSSRGTCNGKKCKPEIFEQWLDGKATVTVKEGVEYHPIMTNSCLVCAHLGEIRPVSSGLEYDGSKDKEKPGTE